MSVSRKMDQPSSGFQRGVHPSYTHQQQQHALHSSIPFMVQLSTHLRCRRVKCSLLLRVRQTRAETSQLRNGMLQFQYVIVIYFKLGRGDRHVLTVFQYTYNDPYVTPYPSSTVDSQQWNQYARASISDESMNSYAFQHYQQQQHLGLYQPSLRDPTRPKSSPSTFGPFPDSINWPVTSSGLGIQYTSTAGQPTPVTSTFPSDMYQPYPVAERYGTYSPPEIRQPQPFRPYTTIAPNPAGIATAKRMRDEDDSADLSSNSNSKKRKRNSSVASADLSEDDRFLVQLKEDESLPWKEIATRFHTDRGKNFQVAALQMRYKRLREKFRMWDEKDIVALRQAAEYWDKYKWDIISQKVSLLPHSAEVPQAN